MDVIGIENPVMDFNILVDKIPATNSITALRDYSWQGGGNISSAIVAAARLGARCGVVGIVGDDEFGQFCIDDFKRHNIDTSHIIKDGESKTTFAICLAEIDTMGRSFIGRRGTNRQLSSTELDKDYISTTKYIHLGQMGKTQVQAAVWAKEMGIIVVDDAGYFNADTNEHTDLIDVFVGSEQYYNGLFQDNNYEKNCRAIQKRGPKIVVFTLGARGCLGIDGDKYFEVPAFHNISIVDTTGAGDVFHGAFIVGLLQGWDVEKTAVFSSAVSAIKCTRLGGRAAIPDYNTVQSFFKTGNIDFTEINKRVEYYREGIFVNRQRKWLKMENRLSNVIARNGLL
jgi:sugar/nucleoside kinase (ribokinase family)